MSAKKVYVLYDCLESKCDKLWVSDGFRSAGYDVEIIDCPYQVSQMERGGKAGVLINRVILFLQSWKAVRRSTPKDVIFCWQQYEGIFTNLLSRGKRNIISYNWLSPRPKKNMKRYYKAALENPKFRAVVNSMEQKEKNLSAYEATDIGNISYIPDVYDQNSTFCGPEFMKSGERYCFMGGRENRDWKLFLEAAVRLPEISFVGVAATSDWDNTNSIPQNVKMHFDLPADQYYQLVKDAYIAVYPLKENRVSGLINIVRGTQQGIPVLITRLSVTEMYYETDLQDILLFAPGDADKMAAAIQGAFQWTEREYCDIVVRMQNYLKEHFSPDMAVNRLLEICKIFG